MEKHKDKINILFVHYSSSTFIKKDLEILQKHFDVKPVQWRGKRDILKVAFSVLKSDLTFSWFAGDHAAIAVFFSKLFRKKSIVIAGGGDVAYVPEISYGQFTLGWHKRMLTKFALKNADIVLPVSNFTKNEILEKVKPKELKVVYNGVDIEKFRPGEKKVDLVITVGNVIKQTIKLKGITTFINVAKYLPRTKFILIGKSDDNAIERIKKIAPPNFEFLGYMSQDDLIGWYQKAKVYCQLSYRESFGMSLAECMACECVPVVTKNAALPEIVGDIGFYVDYGDEKMTVDMIKKALNSNGDLGKKARERIKTLFSKERRREELKKLILEMM